MCNGKNQEQVMIDINKMLYKKFKKICILTVRHSCSSMIKKLEQAGIDYSNYIFIDCVTPTETKVNIDKCFYVTPPINLIEVDIIKDQLTKRYDIELFIFDNIVSLNLHYGDVAVLKFLHTLMIKSASMKIKSLYLTIKGGRKDMMSTIELFADKVIEV